MPPQLEGVVVCNPSERANRVYTCHQFGCVIVSRSSCFQDSCVLYGNIGQCDLENDSHYLPNQYIKPNEQ